MEHALQIADDTLNRDFTGWMAAYRKVDLRALAIAIGVSDKGTNAELLAWIEDHFKQHPDLKLNSRFLGLFNKSAHSAQRKGPAVPSNEGQQEEDIGSMAVYDLSASGHPQLPLSMVPTSTFSSYPPPSKSPPNHHAHQYPPLASYSHFEALGFHTQAHQGTHPLITQSHLGPYQYLSTTLLLQQPPIVFTRIPNI